MYLLDTRWKQMHNAMRVREGTVTLTGSHPPSRWSFCAQGHSMLSQYQALYPAILDIATYLSLNKLLGVDTRRRPSSQVTKPKESRNEQKKHGILSRYLGRRLMFQQGHPDASSGG